MQHAAAITEQLSTYALAWRSAPHGRKGDVLDDATRVLGLARATLHRKFSELVVTPKRRRRADAGTSALNRDEAVAIAAVLVEHMRKQGKRLASVGAALENLRACNMIAATRADPDTGEVLPLSVSAIVRALRMYGLHPDQVLQPAPAIQLATLHPNHVWQIDASRCVLYYLPQRERDNGLRIADAAEFYKNKPANLIRAMRDALWRYVVTDHRTGYVYATYVVGGETTGNLIEAFVGATQQRAGEALHGVPAMVMLDPGSANTSAAFKNLCHALQVRLQVNAPGNPRAKGQVEQAQNIVERDFEASLKTLSLDAVSSLDAINALAAKWRRYFNGTRVHSRHGMTRDQAWLHITPDQLVIAPPADVLRDVSVSAPESRVVSGHLMVSYLGREYDVSAVPGVMIGEKLMVCRNPMRGTAQAIGVGDDGRDIYYLLPEVKRDAFGQVEGAPVIGESYARHADTPAQRARQEIELFATGTSTLEEAAQARKQRAQLFDGRYDPFRRIDETEVPAALPRRGTQHELTPVHVEQPPLTHAQAGRALRAAATDGWTPAHYETLVRLYPGGVPADEVDTAGQRIASALDRSPVVTPFRRIA